MKLRELRQHYKKDKNKWVPKLSFKTRKDAETYLRKIKGKYAPQVPFKCKVCSNYHVATDWNTNVA